MWHSWLWLWWNWRNVTPKKPENLCILLNVMWARAVQVDLESPQAMIHTTASIQTRHLVSQGHLSRSVWKNTVLICFFIFSLQFGVLKKTASKVSQQSSQDSELYKSKYTLEAGIDIVIQFFCHTTLSMHAKWLTLLSVRRGYFQFTYLGIGNSKKWELKKISCSECRPKMTKIYPSHKFSKLSTEVQQWFYGELDFYACKKWVTRHSGYQNGFYLNDIVDA